MAAQDVTAANPISYQWAQAALDCVNGNSFAVETGPTPQWEWAIQFAGKPVWAGDLLYALSIPTVFQWDRDKGNLALLLLREQVAGAWLTKLPLHKITKKAILHFMQDKKGVAVYIGGNQWLIYDLNNFKVVYDRKDTAGYALLEMS